MKKQSNPAPKRKGVVRWMFVYVERVRWKITTEHVINEETRDSARRCRRGFERGSCGPIVRVVLPAPTPRRAKETK